MQLAQPLAHHAGKVVKRPEGVRRSRGCVVLQCCVFERAPEIVESPGPSVALVRNVALNDEQRVGNVFLVDADDLAQELGSIGETADGQAPRHLRLGVHPRQDAPDQLDHRRVAQDQRTVGLLRRQPTDSGVAEVRQGVDARFTEATDLAVPRRQDCALA